MARITLVGEQVLAAHPDSGVIRATLAGEQVLAAAPPNVTRVSNSAIEVLVQGSPSPRGRATLVGEQVLAATPSVPMRVSNSAIELLVTGSPPTRGRATLVGEQVLAKAPYSPMRVSNSLLELLIAGIPNQLAPGKLFAASGTASVASEYLAPDAAQSDLVVDAAWRLAASPAAYAEEGSGGRLHALGGILSLPSSILTAEPAGRLYGTRSTATLDLAYPLPSASLSDLYADSISRVAAVGAAYEPGGSDLTVSSLLAQTAVPTELAIDGSTLTISSIVRLAGTPVDYVTPGSTVTVSHVRADAAAPADYLDKEEIQSTLRVSHVRAGAAAPAEYLDKEEIQSTLTADEVRREAAVGVAYPPVETVIPAKRLHQVSAVASLPAGWLELQKTLLRMHFGAGQATFSLDYPSPADMRPPIDVSYLVPAAAFSSTRNLGGGPAIEATAVARLAAVPAIYEGPDAPQSVVSVSELALLVVSADTDFGDLSTGAGDSLPIVSIQLFYEE